jgi:ATP-dependent Clp protease ATP-binding subunit ClpX
MFDLPSLDDVNEVVIDKAVVEKKKAPLVIYKSPKAITQIKKAKKAS